MNIDKDRVPWLLQLLYDFPYAMDLTDEEGKPDHDKMLPAFAAVAFMVFIFLNPRPTWEAMIAWIVAGGYVYGFSAWRLVLDRVVENQNVRKHLERIQNSETPPEPPSSGE